MSQFALQLYDQYYDQVYNYVYFRVRNIQLAEDIVSEVFMKVVRNCDSYQEQAGATERSWLFAITRNTITDYYRSHKEVEDISEMQIASKQSLSNDVHTKLLFEQVVEVIDELPERQREIVSLRYLSGLQNKEIAGLLQIDERTVSGTLSKGMQHLRMKLSVHV